MVVENLSMLPPDYCVPCVERQDRWVNEGEDETE